MDERAWERQRSALLAELDLLDAPEEEQFRSAAALAATVCGMPMAAVSLVDGDRQFFAGVFGLGMRQTERAVSFCAYAIRDPGQPMLISDTTKDGRFVDNRLVTGDPYVRAYAGVPMVSPEGVPLGTLCVLDAAPRQLSVDQVAALSHLALVTMDLLQAKRTARALVRALEAGAVADRQRDTAVGEFRSAFEHAPIGMTISAVDGTYLQVNAAFAEALGRTSADLVGSNVSDLTAPDEHPEGGAVVAALLERGHGSSLLERTLVGADGCSHPALVTVSLVRGTDSPPRLLEHVEFIAERRLAETQLLETQSAIDAIVSVDSRDRIISWNRGAERMFGHARAAAMTRPLSMIIPGPLRTRHENGRSGAMTALAPRLVGSTVEVAALRADGKELVVEVSLSPWSARDGQHNYTAVLRDITDRIRAEALSDMLRVAAVTANSATTLSEAAPPVIAAVCTRLGWPAGHAWYTDEATAHWFVAEHAHCDDPGEAGTHGASSAICPLRELAAVGSRPCPDHHPVGGGVVIEGFPAESTDPTFQRALAACGVGPALAVPLLAGQSSAGVLAFYLPHDADTSDASLLRDIKQVGTLLGRVVERERTARLHAHQALHDPLTNLANRRLLYDAIAVASTADRSWESGTSALYLIGVDRFKLINHSLGHAAGDDLLLQVAGRLSAATRPVDTVARLGGDEFAVLLRGLPNEAAVAAAGDRLLQAVEGPAEVHRHALHVSASAGVAIVDAAQHADPPALLRAADAALRQAKHVSRGKTKVFDLALRMDAVRRLDDETALRPRFATDSCACTTSRSSICRRESRPAQRRCCAGSAPGEASSNRVTSSRRPRTPGSSSSSVAGP